MDICIGEGDFGSTWIKCYEDSILYISSNIMSYRISHKDITIKIGKDTCEGKELAVLIKGLQSTSIMYLIDYIVLKNISVEVFRSMLKMQYDKGYSKGDSDRLDTILSALKL